MTPKLHIPMPVARRGAFTLIELLVVVTLIVLLLALLLPSLNRAIRAGERTTCASQEKQISLAVFAYASDNFGFYPPCTGGGGKLAPNGVTTQADDWWWYPEWLATYVSDRRIYICPNDTGWSGTNTGASQQWDYNSYPTNLVYPIKRGDASKRPSALIYATEWGSYPGFSWHDPIPGAGPSSQWNDALNNLLFVDGHVAYMKIYWNGANWAYQSGVPDFGGYDYLWTEQ
jgi:prepilin-type N-terminal cleavage/methylation domain-containing protein/prepilin-type processing-associated H-X9-DG protein